jgi:hypothetical protein
MPTFWYFWVKISLLTFFKTLISQKQRHSELQNKFNLIRNKLLEFIQFSFNRLLSNFLSFRFLKSNAPFFSGRRKYKRLLIWCWTGQISRTQNFVLILCRKREKKYFNFYAFFNCTGGPRYLREIETKTLGSHIMNLHIKKTKDTYK